MIKMKKVNIFLVLLSVLFVLSCDSNAIQDISAVIENPTYSAHVQPVFEAKCIGCHNGSQSPNLSNYNQVKMACTNGGVLCRIEGSCGSIMPPSGKMPQSTIDMIIKWTDNGCPN
jgi:hypothetical protein